MIHSFSRIVNIKISFLYYIGDFCVKWRKKEKNALVFCPFSASNGANTSFFAMIKITVCRHVKKQIRCCHGGEKHL